MSNSVVQLYMEAIEKNYEEYKERDKSLREKLEQIINEEHNREPIKYLHNPIHPAER